MKTFTSTVVLFLGVYCCGQPSTTFKEMLQIANMSFNPLENFGEIPSLSNDVMEYEYAARNDEGHVEVRYAIRPIYAPNESANEEEREAYLLQAETENTHYKMFMTTAILNLSGGRESKVKDLYEFDRKKIAADWGGSSFVVLNSSFSKEYKYCQLIVIYKKDRAICYCYFLSNDIKKLIKISREATQNLKFN